MKIVYFSDVTYPQISGVSSHLDDICMELSGRNHKILIFSPRIKDQRKIKNVTYYHLNSVALPSKSIKDQAVFALPWVKQKYLKVIKDFEPDIIHIQTPYFAGSLGRKIAKEIGVPFIETMHGYFTKEGFLNFIKNDTVGNILQKLIWKILISQLKNARAVIVPSKIASKDLIKYGLRNRIYLIHNGIKLPHVTPLNLNSKNILYLGRISWEKNLEVLLESFQKVLMKLPDTKLFLVGDGPSRTSLVEKVRELNITENVEFTGSIDRDKLLTISFFNKFRLFAVTSITENNPVSVLEAMSFGLPVVALRGKGMDELVEDTGMIFDKNNIKGYSDAIINILTDKELAKKLSKRSITKAGLYNIKNCVDLLENTYNKVITNNQYG